MSFLWDSNILRHYLEDHPLLLTNLKRVSRQEVWLPIVVVAEQLSRTRKRYADVLIAAQVLAGQHILVTRNTSDFRDLLPMEQLQNWVDNEVR